MRLSRRPRVRLSVRIKLLGAFLAMTTLAAALLLYGFLTAASQLQARTVTQLEVLTSSEAAEMRTTMDRLLQDVVTLTRLPALSRRADAGLDETSNLDRARIAEDLSIFTKAKKCYQPVRVLVTSASGRQIVRLEDQGSGLSSAGAPPEETAGNDVAARVAALPPERVYVSPITRAGPDDAPGAAGGSQIEYAASIVARDGTARGVLAVTVRIDYLLAHIAMRPPEGLAFLAGEDGHYLAYDRAEGASSAAGSLARGLRDDFGAADADRIGLGAPGSAVTDRDTVAAFVPVPIGNADDGRHWVLGMIVPKASFLAPVRRFVQVSAILLAAALIGFVALAVLLTRHFTLPLRELHRGTEVVAAGNLDHRIAIATGDEMEWLANKFNAMTERLAESRRVLESWNEKLEREVRERTSDLARAEARVRAEKQKLDDIVSSIGGELCLLGPDGRIVWANRAMAEQRGGIERILGHPCFEVLRTRDRLCEDCQMPQMAHTGQPHRELRVSRTPSGEERYLQIVVTPVKDTEGKVSEFLLLSVDVTEPLLRERATRRHLAQAEKLASLGQLAAGIVHDVANPLAAIKTTLQVMQETVDGDEKTGRYVDRAIAEIDRLASFLQKFTAFAKPKPPEFERRDANTVVREVLALLSASAHKRGVALRESLPAGEVRAMLDASQVQQVVLNLVVNALEATQPGGSVAVDVSAIPRGSNGCGPVPCIRIAVTDTGAGIDPAHRDHLFDPFFTTKQNGTGLGLAIAYQIVREHGGSMHVESKLGRGSTFSIEIPRDRNPAIAHGVLREAAAHLPLVPVDGISS